MSQPQERQGAAPHAASALPDRALPPAERALPRPEPVDLEVLVTGEAEIAQVRALLAPDSQLETIATGGIWFEGPTWLGANLVWSDVAGNALWAWDRERGARIWIAPSHHQNGHTTDSSGRLLAASHGERAVVRREHDGSWVILADLIDGQRFNSPNDVVVAGDGGIWFTDPYYGLEQETEGFGGSREVDGAHVYRISPSGRGLLGGTNVRNLTASHPSMPAPNGLAFSPDGTVLYVTDSRARHVLGFVVRYSLEGPELGFRWKVHETRSGNPDGMRVDPAGRLWVSSGEGVEVLAPPVVGQRSRHLAVLHTPRTTANLAFAPDLRTLALTSTDAVHLLALGDVTV